ncbi:acyltransferase family protein [Novosphingobium sediminicola]|uniref:Peptidoglycan/LPS O-acetylase OafA/YrhL n=1 Tax=Novosphingobium sediminicola TaxID=563162 RepID=A0A7W6CHV1_9SPHN|nr:acyltransferase [Novosphingobium sediminicola]MBB3956838.1 peptidoglycan/LPS O-acetylase OafA/YrhL [Novosphingobium sediminicola]
MASVRPDKHVHAGVIVPVQFLRGIAASFVVTVHFLDRLVKRGAFLDPLPDWTHSFGEMGVATFFAISGFIMVHTTGNEFGSLLGGRRFLTRRFVRVAPMYYVTTILSVIFAFATFHLSTNKIYVAPTFYQIVMSFMFLPYIDVNGIAHPVYGLGWTLEYEMLFYAVFALAMLMPLRKGMIVATAFLLGATALGLALDAPLTIVGTPVPLYFFTRPLLLYFVIGMMLGVARRQGMCREVPLPAWGMGLIGVACMLLGVRFAGPGVSFVSLVAVMVTMMTATLLKAREEASTAFERFSKAFGSASYSLYLTHSFLLGLIAVVTERIAGKSTLSLVLVVLIACIVCFVAAWQVWKNIEVPLMRKLQPR